MRTKQCATTGCGNKFVVSTKPRTKDFHRKYCHDCALTRRREQRRKDCQKWRRNPKNRKFYLEQHRAYNRKWLRDPKNRKLRREQNRKWRSNWDAVTRTNKTAALLELGKAVKRGKAPLKNGRPDAGNVEQKVGKDYLRADQLRCAASVLKHLGIFVELHIYKTRLDAMMKRGRVFRSFCSYFKTFGPKRQEAIQLWDKLLAVVPPPPKSWSRLGAKH